jgi:ATP-dependent DNA helicase PIF1
MLGWALSVHKCQGMTLDRVETNLSKAFGHGMVYVALSRVKSLQGLRLIGFDPSRIKILPVVARFYENLSKKSVVNLDDDDFA